MVIQHSYEILCELGQIEDQIREVQQKLSELGVECHDDALLNELIRNKIYRGL